MGPGGNTSKAEREGPVRPVRTLDALIATRLAELDGLRAERQVSKRREAISHLDEVRLDYEGGVDRRQILRSHRITLGQLAGWANRFGWSRPDGVVGSLNPQERTRYEALRITMPKAAAVQAARNSSRSPIQPTLSDNIPPREQARQPRRQRSVAVAPPITATATESRHRA